MRLEKVIIKNGYAEAQGPKPDGGGAIANYGGVLTLHNSALNLNFGDHGGAIFNTGSLIVEANTRFRRNNSHQGGAIYNGSSAGIPISITDATFYKNTADGLDLGLGGAIYNAGTDGAGMNISDSEFTENTASGSGGAIYTADPDAPMQIYHSSFYDNGVSKDGGAIYQEKGTVHLTLTMLIHNRAWVSSGSCGGNHEYDQRGGAIYVDHGTLEVNQSSFNNNSAEYAGGTIYNFRGTVSITGSSLANGKTNDSQTSACSNISSYGGCIYNTRSLTIENSSILNCSSEYGGGLMHGLTNVVPVTATLINVSLIGNQAIIAGGNISTFSNLDLNFVTLHLGKADVGRSIFVGGGYTRVKDSIFDINLTENDNNCVIDDGLFSVFGENIDRTSTCPNFSIREDPDLIYSGNDQYYYLNDYSPARDKSDCLTLLGSTVQTDQIGHNRPPPEEVQCDLGAIEMEELPSPPPPEPEIMPRLYAPENLTCREGDSTEYPAAGYLMAGEAADVIG